MSEEMDVGTPRKHGRVVLAVLVAAVVVAALIGAGVWFFLSMRRTAHDKLLVEEATTAAFACVISLRGDAPEAWGLERALEHMSRMERVTRDVPGPERERFARLAADAAAGCRQLSTLMVRAHAESPDLYFAVPARLAQSPDEEDAERWFRRTLPKSRAEVEELTRQIRAMDEAINARRGEHDLMARQLPIGGGDAGQLARIIVLEPLPRDLELPSTEAWPLDEQVLVLRRASIPAVPCQTRYTNRLSCFRDFVQEVSWTGEAMPLFELERPANVAFWAAFGPTPDGNLWAAGMDTQRRGIVGRYAPASTTAETALLAAPVDASSLVVAVLGGVVVMASDGRTMFSRGDLAFAPAAELPPPLLIAPRDGATATVDGLGTLTIFGSREEGWTSRFTNETADVLQRMIDANSLVEGVAGLRAQPSGRAVAILRREGGAADALAITTDLGRTWLTQPQ